ncbi:thiamine phosphate synthase [Flavobacteriaceae bacterium R38]|nr:thiamine phosphate synthase [Flavobacteriaceae bacterium R38]
MISKLHYISQGKTAEEHLQNIQRACVSGADWIQLRLKDMNEEDLLDTAIKAREITSHFQTRLIINDHHKIAIEVKADGVHLGKSDICPIIARKELFSWQIIGGTANTLDDCLTLIDKKVDYIGLGPYQFTKTKENLSPILGKNGYIAIIEELKTDIPVLAIGGIDITNVEEIIDTGVYGIAVSSEITRDFNNISKFNKILKGPSMNEEVWKAPKENTK